MSRIGRAASRVALRLHPAAWRARYADEVGDLIDDSDSSLTDAADLARSALDHHLEGATPMRFEPAYRHPTGWAVVAALVLLPTFAIVALSVIGHELGITAVATATDPFMRWLDTIRPLDLLLVVAPLVAFVVALAPLLDLSLERVDGERTVAVRLRTLTGNLAVAAAAFLTGSALVAHIVTEAVLQAGA